MAEGKEAHDAAETHGGIGHFFPALHSFVCLRVLLLPTAIIRLIGAGDQVEIEVKSPLEVPAKHSVNQESGNRAMVRHCGLGSPLSGCKKSLSYEEETT